MGELSTADVRFALDLAQENGFQEVRLAGEFGEFTAELMPRPRPQPAALVAETVAVPLFIKSMHVGFFRAANPAVELGSTVKAGQVVGSVETLGLLNDVESKVTGTVTQVHVTADDAVDFGRVLFTVEA